MRNLRCDPVIDLMERSAVWRSSPRCGDRGAGVVLGVGGGVRNLVRFGLLAGRLRARDEGRGSDSGRDGVLDGVAVVECS